MGEHACGAMRTGGSRGLCSPCQTGFRFSHPQTVKWRVLCTASDVEDRAQDQRGSDVVRPLGSPPDQPLYAIPPRTFSSSAYTTMQLRLEPGPDIVFVMPQCAEVWAGRSLMQPLTQMLPRKWGCGWG